MANKAGKKHIIVEVSLDHHKEIKQRAADQYMTIKDWILLAIKEKIEKEKGLGWK